MTKEYIDGPRFEIEEALDTTVDERTDFGSFESLLEGAEQDSPEGVDPLDSPWGVLYTAVRGYANLVQDYPSTVEALKNGNYDEVREKVDKLKEEWGTA